MRRRVNFWMRRLFSCYVSRPGTPQAGAGGLRRALQPPSSPPQAPSDVDVREEYANAFRTESYYQFWARILELTHNDAATRRSMDSTSAARLPSYRLFAEHLLDPDQPTVTQLLSSAQIRPENQTLLSDYFSETTNASLLCGVLLKDIEKVRAKYQSLKKTIESLEYLASGCVNPKPVILTRLSEFTKSVNPFVPSSSSLTRFRAVQEICSGLLRRLEQGRDRAEAKLWLLNGLKRGSAIFLVALTVSVAVIAVSHALVMVVAMPALMVASPELASASKLAKMSAQLDAAAKGTYILNRDLDTISRLLSRLYDEVEHTRTMIEFWLGIRGIYRVQASGEVARHLKKNDSSFCDQLDELEEHLYLCFMTINRARNLVVKEILGVGPISVTSP